MKKLLFLSSALIVLLSSCSKEDDPIVEPTIVIDPTALLPQEIIIKNSNGGILQSNKFTYEGKKLLKMVDNSNYTTQYFYSENGNGSRIIKTQEKNSASVLYKNTDYTYLQNGKIDEITETFYGSFNQKYRHKFDYSNNNYAAFTTFYSTTTGGVFTAEILDKTGKIYYDFENKIIKLDKFDSSNPQFNKSNELTYDTKNSPFKNVIGYDNLADYDQIFVFKTNYLSKLKNVKELRSPRFDNSGATASTDYDIYSYIFNNVDFPTSGTITKQNLANNTSVNSSIINSLTITY
jgi:hypothetical protein